MLPPAPPDPAQDDGPTAAEAASQARAQRAAAKLANEAEAALTDLVEALHAQVADMRGLNVDGRPRAIDGLAYKTVRGVARPAGNGVDTLRAVLATLLDPAGWRAQAREAILAALNGVLGDTFARTASPLAIGMALRHGGVALPLERGALATALPQAGGKPLVLIHDLGMNDLQWRRPDGQDHGETLAVGLGFTPVRLHYNSGLRVSTNGRALANRLARLLDQWPHPLARFAIVAHGMGGLLARSALSYGLAAGHHWPHRLDDLACLGTPHHGAMLEGLARLLEPSPYAAPLTRLARQPGAGLADLRHGNLVDEDWVNGERAEGATDRRKALPLPAGTRCHAMAGATAPPHKPASDGLVPVTSALGIHRLARRTLKFAPEHQRVLDDTDHLQLLSSPEAARQLCEWLRH